MIGPRTCSPFLTSLAQTDVARFAGQEFGGALNVRALLFVGIEVAGRIGGLKVNNNATRTIRNWAVPLRRSEVGRVFRKLRPPFFEQGGAGRRLVCRCRQW